MKKQSRPGSRQPAPPKTWDRLDRFANRFGLVLVLFLMLVALGLRLFDLRADPPPDLSWSSAIYSDEAHNAYSARNWALYGRWQLDDYIPYVVYPWLNIVTGLVFKLFGIGFVQLKVVSVLAGTLLVLVVYLLARAAGNTVSGLIAALLTACCFPLVMYSRLGLAEISQVLFLAAAGLFLTYGARHRLAALLSGVMAWAAVLFVKVSSIFCPVAIVALLVVETIQHRRDRARLRSTLSQLLFWAIGALLPVALWLGLIFLPHRADYLGYVFRHSLGAKAGHPAGIGAYLLNAFSVGAGSKLLSRMPLTALLGFLALPALSRSRGRPVSYLRYLLIAGVAMLGYQYYHPDRYELFTILPLIIAFALVISQLSAGRARIAHPWPNFWGALGYGLWLWPMMGHIGIATRGFWGILTDRTGTSLLVLALLAGLGASFLLYGLHRATRGGSRLTRPGLRSAAAVLLVLALGNELARYNTWVQSRTHNMFRYSQDLAAALPPGSVTAGFWAPALLALSTQRALFVSDGWHVNLTDPVARFGVTHLVAADQDELRLLDSITGHRAAHGRVLRRYPVRDRELIVLELPP